LVALFAYQENFKRPFATTFEKFPLKIEMKMDAHQIKYLILSTLFNFVKKKNCLFVFIIF